jgi:predicted metal-dependent hydrolase
VIDDVLERVEIEFSARKTAVVFFKANKLVVRAPKSFSRQRVLDLLTSQAQILLKRWHKFQEAQKDRQDTENFFETHQFWFLGRTYNLEDPTECLKLGIPVNLMERLHQPNGKAKVRAYLTKWYKQQAQKLFTDQVEYFSEVMNLDFRRITINSNKRRVGCCNIKGDLKFSWRIIMLPVEIINYLVVHELAHRVHHNHSPAFWNLVRKYDPDYKTDLRFLHDRCDFIGEF